MKLLACSGQYGRKYIVEMSDHEVRQFLGLKHNDQIPETGTGIERHPCKLLEASNSIITRANNAQQTSSQLRALAEMIDTVIPGIQAIVNPPEPLIKETGDGD